jgi:hypothetical protein
MRIIAQRSLLFLLALWIVVTAHGMLIRYLEGSMSHLRLRAEIEAVLLTAVVVIPGTVLAFRRFKLAPLLPYQPWMMAALYWIMVLAVPAVELGGVAQKILGGAVIFAGPFVAIAVVFAVGNKKVAHG